MVDIGWHFQGGVPDWAPEIVNAGWNKVMDPGDRDPFPGRQTVGRTYVDDNASNQMVMQGAKGAETWFALQRSAYEKAPWVYAWEGPNEPPVGTLEQRRALSAFTIRHGELLHGIGRRHVGLNLSVGWTDIGTAVDLGPCLASCDYIGLHEYSAPTMQAGAGWYCLRYRRTVEEWRNAGYKVPPILITECGIDGGVIGRPRTGYKSYCSRRAEYAEQLRWYLSETRKDPIVAGMMVFTSTPIGWDEFDVDIGLSRLIAEINEEEVQMDDVLVFHNGETHDLAWLQANYGRGIEVRRASGAAKFKLTAISIMTSGETNLRIWVKGRDGGAKVGQPCTYSYPDPATPDADLALIPAQYKSRWSERGVLNKNQTGGDGAVNFQIGQGSWIRPESGRGPYTAWVLSPSIESDAIAFTGWKMATNHEGPVELFFAEVSGTPDPEPEPEPEPGPGDLAAVVAELRNVNKNLGVIAELIRSGFRL